MSICNLKKKRIIGHHDNQIVIVIVVIVVIVYLYISLLITFHFTMTNELEIESSSVNYEDEEAQLWRQAAPQHGQKTKTSSDEFVEYHFVSKRMPDEIWLVNNFNNNNEWLLFVSQNH